MTVLSVYDWITALRFMEQNEIRAVMQCGPDLYTYIAVDHVTVTRDALPSKLSIQINKK